MTIGVLLTQKQTIISGDVIECVDNDGASGCNNDNLQYVQPVTTYWLHDKYRFSARVKLYRCNTYL